MADSGAVNNSVLVMVEKESISINDHITLVSYSAKKKGQYHGSIIDNQRLALAP